MIRLPIKIKILDVVYKIKYMDKPCDVNIHKRVALWGEVDYWTRTIRVYKNDRTEESIKHTILHEIIHAVSGQLNLGLKENTVERLTSGIGTVFMDNEFLWSK